MCLVSPNEVQVLSISTGTVGQESVVLATKSAGFSRCCQNKINSSRSPPNPSQELSTGPCSRKEASRGPSTCAIRSGQASWWPITSCNPLLLLPLPFSRNVNSDRPLGGSSTSGSPASCCPAARSACNHGRAAGPLPLEASRQASAIDDDRGRTASWRKARGVNGLFGSFRVLVSLC